MITQTILKQLFNYDSNGYLIWKVKPNGNIKIGNKVGSINSAGYYSTIIKYKNYLIHRLIFLYHHGYLPDYVDHINGNPLDNRIENLRECTKSQNNCNSKKPKNNTSGVKGITWHKRHKKWYVRIFYEKQKYELGLFDDLDLAKKTLDEFRMKLHGNFARND